MDVTAAPESALSARWPGGQTAALLAWWVDGVLLRQQKPSRMALAWLIDGVLLVWRVGGAFWVDGAPAADPQRTRVPWSAPVRSAATAKPPHHQVRSENPQSKPGAAATDSRSRKFAPHNKTPIKIRGTDYPSLVAIIIGGRQAECVYPPS